MTSHHHLKGVMVVLLVGFLCEHNKNRGTTRQQR